MVKPAPRKIQPTRVGAPSGPSSTLSSRTPAYIYEFSIFKPDESYDGNPEDDLRTANSELGLSDVLDHEIESSKVTQDFNG